MIEITTTMFLGLFGGIIVIQFIIIVGLIKISLKAKFFNGMSLGKTKGYEAIFGEKLYGKSKSSKGQRQAKNLQNILNQKK